jgi:hypothetical protein
MTNLENCYACQLVASCEDANITYQLLIENVESLVEAIVRYWKLLFEARGTRECRFRGRLIGGGKESAGLFELWVVRRVYNV